MDARNSSLGGETGGLTKPDKGRQRRERAREVAQYRRRGNRFQSSQQSSDRDSSCAYLRLGVGVVVGAASGPRTVVATGREDGTAHDGSRLQVGRADEMVVARELEKGQQYPSGEASPKTGKEADGSIPDHARKATMVKFWFLQEKRV